MTRLKVRAAGVLGALMVLAAVAGNMQDLVEADKSCCLHT